MKTVQSVKRRDRNEATLDHPVMQCGTGFSPQRLRRFLKRSGDIPVADKPKSGSWQVCRQDDFLKAWEVVWLPQNQTLKAQPGEAGTKIQR
ncbi:hypothetical protein [Pontiella desulfatans]|uniref:hypothetical protein n=1 Tax=Pontiella desulfatans TaxID=2750659 RepID=UPI00109D29A3|nr:hypothetical protein [Pontiella desulfatans]